MIPIIPRASVPLPPRPSLAHVDVHPGIIIHCTAGHRPATKGSALEKWLRVWEWHTMGNGWHDIGYHFGVTPDGRILEGRGWGVRGAHAKGYNRWIGIVVQGKGLEMTAEEKAAIVALHAIHIARGGGEVVLPHNAVSRKACPGPVVTQWVLDTFPQPRAA